MSLVITALMIIVGFSILVFVHEFGHFVVAKLFKIRVHEFFLGFGPKLIKIPRGETTYGIAAFPLGGYVKLSGMEEEAELPPEEEARSFRAQAKWKRVLVILAGPGMNILFSIPLFMLVFAVTPRVIDATTTMTQVEKASPAEKAGIQKGDKVVAVDGKPIKRFSELQAAIKRDLKKPDRKIELTIERGDETKIIVATLRNPNIKRGPPKPALGVAGKSIEGPPLSLGQSFVASVQFTWTVSKTIFLAIAGLFTGGTELKTFADSSAGPIGIVSILGHGANQGIMQFIWLIAIIGPNLAIVNLFPLLPLDGGRIVIIGYEALRRKPANKERIMQLQMAGFFLLLALIVTLTVSDIGKLASGRGFTGT